MGYIYILTSPSGKSYIGQTVRTIEERFEEHEAGKSNSCRAIYNAIKFHGWENFEKDWYECPNEDLNKHEELMVEVLGTLSPGGYNLREGGGSHGKLSEESKKKMSEARLGEKNHNFGKPRTKETKQRISEALFGKLLMEETKQKMSETRLGKTHTEETKQKMSEAQLGEKNHMYGKNGEKNQMFGKFHTEETKQKMSEAKRGKTHTEEHKQKNREARLGEKNHMSKTVYQYDMEGVYIRSFGSAGEAARYMGKRGGTNISACACGKLKKAYGFKWSYNANVIQNI